MRSMWLCKKPRKKWALRPTVIRKEGSPPQVDFEIFKPIKEEEVGNGSVSRAKATCISCRSVLPPERVRSQLASQYGGADATFDEQSNRIGGARMTAVVTVKPGQQGRHYRLPTDGDYLAIYKAQQRIAHIADMWEKGGRQGDCPIPDEPLPIERQKGNSGFRILLYGMRQWGHLFTSRQKAALLVSGDENFRLRRS